MSNCQHAECHSIQNCAICSKEGAAWCPHQECRYRTIRRLGPISAPRQFASEPGVAWTPTLAGNFLKLLFVSAAVAGTWWLLKSGGNGYHEAQDPLVPSNKTPGRDFSPWEPQP